MLKEIRKFVGMVGLALLFSTTPLFILARRPVIAVESAIDAIGVNAFFLWLILTIGALVCMTFDKNALKPEIVALGAFAIQIVGSYWLWGTESGVFADTMVRIARVIILALFFAEILDIVYQTAIRARTRKGKD